MLDTNIKNNADLSGLDIIEKKQYGISEIIILKNLSSSSK